MVEKNFVWNNYHLGVMPEFVCRTEENYKNFTDDNRCSDRNSNREYPEWLVRSPIALTNEFDYKI